MSKSIKKKFSVFAILFFVGLLLVLFINDNKYWKFSNIGFIAFGLSLIWIFNNTEALLNAFFPIKLSEDPKSKFEDKLWKFISSFVFFLGMVFFVFQFKNLESLIEESTVYKYLSLAGIIFGILFLFILFKIQPSIFQNNSRRHYVLLGIGIGFIFWTIGAFSCFNKMYASEKIVSTKYELHSKSSGKENSDQYWIHIIIEDSEKRFTIDRSDWSQLKVADTVILNTQKGFFNFDFVNKISTQ